MMPWIGLAVGGIAGTFSRYLLGGMVQRLAGGDFPLGTLIVNIAGCFFAGFLAVFADEKLNLGFTVRVFLITGFCGAFTTFSALMIETDSLLRHGSFLKAAVNIIATVILGLCLFRFGAFLAQKIS